MSDVRTARILLVEDDAGKRYVIARQLRAAGFTIEEADTGAKALAMVTSDHDVVILDLQLPDMHGLEVCDRIKKAEATAGVMVLELSSSFATAEDRAKGLELGADAYLVHPVEIIELTATLRALVRLRHAVRERDQERELFLATISHDLRNPLMAISVAGQALADSPKLGPDEKNVLAMMERSSDRMQRLIDRLLVYTQSMTGSLSIANDPIDLVEVTRSVIEELASSTDRQILLEGPLDAPLDGDHERLTQLIDNLVANAIRYGVGPINVKIARAGAHATISVHNDGKPIDADMLATLFQPFKKSRTKGSFGLGLYIADRIALAHRGRLHVTSSAADGTTFVVELPIRSGDA